uniref:Protein CutA n=1 Tax=Coturnix japonica TaxID=93934 RepID=A0A8C2Y9G8_COTJA
LWAPAAPCPPPRAVTLSLLMYPMLRSLALQLHSAITGSYVSGTHSIVFINCLNEQIAKDIARGIMDKKLAAYVNILPKSSAFLFLLWDVAVALRRCVCFHFRSIHPFEIPEVISLPIDQGNPLYLKWIGENVPRD